MSCEAENYPLMFGVQGIKADSDTLGNVENLILGEGFVLIKSEIVIEAVRRYQEGLS